LLFVQTNRNLLSYTRFEKYSLKRVNDYFDSVQRLLRAPASARLAVMDAFDDGGETTSGTFREALLVGAQYALERSHQPPTRPRFAVIDQSAAHHVSAPLAEWAFAHGDAAWPRLRMIVHFAVHRGSPYPMSGHGAMADAYVNFGVSSGSHAKVSGNLGGGLYQLARDDGLQPRRIIPENHPTPTVTEQLATVVGWFPPSDIDFYISIDRNFMIGSHTLYGDGSQLPDAGRAAVLEALLFFQHGLRLGARATLVGFDVTGLPCLGGFNATGIKEPTAIEQANEDLITFYRQVRDYSA